MLITKQLATDFNSIFFHTMEVCCAHNNKNNNNKKTWLFINIKETLHFISLQTLWECYFWMFFAHSEASSNI